MESEPDYKEDVEKLRGFLESFREDDIDGTPQVKYMVILQMVANRREKMVHIDLDDVYEALGDEIGDRMKDNTKRYQRLLAEAIDKIMPDPTVDQLEEDVADILLRSRLQQTRDGHDAEATHRLQHVVKVRTTVDARLPSETCRERGMEDRPIRHADGLESR